MAMAQEAGMLPTHNFQEGTFDGWKKLYGATITRKYLVRTKACHSCPIACGRVTKVEESPYEGEGEGPEYETLYALGSNCGIDNLAAVIKANYICNELGLEFIAPLWDYNADELWKELLEKEFEVVLTKISCEGLGEGWLGKIINKEDFEELKKLGEKHGFRVDFEGGEAETGVLWMPGFKKHIKIDFDIVNEGEYRHWIEIKDIK